jgi:hypothetical protein
MARKTDSKSKTIRAQAGQKAKQGKEKSQKILKGLGLTQKEYRSYISRLKKSGIVSKKIDARSHKPTRHMADKIRKYKDVASGAAMAIPAQKVRPDLIDQYVKQGTAQLRDKFFIRSKSHAREKLSVERGLLKTTIPLKNGESDVIYLPFSAANFNEYLEMLKNREDEINQMKGPTEQFGFQIYGHNSLSGQPDVEHLINYIETRYESILKNRRASREIMRDQEFVLLRFRNKYGKPLDEPYLYRKRYSRTNATGRDDDRYYYENRERRGREMLRKRRQRKNETDEQKQKRLERQREYDRKRVEIRREKRMAERLLGEKAGGKKDDKPKRK